MNVSQVDFRPRKISWQSVAQAVNAHATKPYTPQYIRDVAVGYRTNNRLTELLNSLGVFSAMQKCKEVI
ncbi:MAG: hypothetical protein LBC75_01095 [Fibromonadaceae bacterium]|nr:hypothetical protein [Fibromonadaceae bacterium]